MISNANPGVQFRSYQNDIEAAISRVCTGGYYVLGPEVDAFEREFAEFVGVANGVGVASGTDALVVALKACGIGLGDEVITVGHTAVATVAAIESAGATAVLVDIESSNFTLDPSRLEAAITDRTKAVAPVHLYGQPADLDAIVSISRRHGLRVVEDCAQAHGAMYHDRRVGAFGDIGCFSFYPTKNLGGLGDGGMAVTDDDGLAKRMRMIREYGWEERFISSVPGINSRLDELQAAILRVKLPHLDADNARRVEVARRYDQALGDSPLALPVRRPGCTHVYHLYVVRAPRRDAFREFLSDRGIGTGIHYPVPVHLQPAYAGRLARPGGLNQTEKVAREILSLPIYPELGVMEVEEVVGAVNQFFSDAHREPAFSEHI